MPILVNKKNISHFNFSGGECHVNIAEIDIDEVTEVLAYLHNSNDVMCLMMIVDAIKRKKINTKINLTIPYFPYARQDRVCNSGEAFGVAVMADMINSLGCNSVTIYDPHSCVVSKFLKNCIVVTQAEIIKQTIMSSIIRNKNLILVAPDIGAENKTRDIANMLNLEAIYCKKNRNIKTGRIDSVYVPEGISGKDVIIVDDICDRGGTVIELAKALKKREANLLYLYVTHGIFARGLDVLKNYFEHIYCYHCFLSKKDTDHKFLTIL